MSPVLYGSMASAVFYALGLCIPIVTQLCNTACLCDCEQQQNQLWTHLVWQVNSVAEKGLRTWYNDVYTAAHVQTGRTP